MPSDLEFNTYMKNKNERLKKQTNSSGGGKFSVEEKTENSTISGTTSAITNAAGLAFSNPKTKVEKAVYDLKECILKHKSDITKAQNSQFTKEKLEKLCDFKYISKVHFTAYFVKWDEGDVTYAGLSEQYKGNSSGTYGEPEKKSFLNNGSEIYTEFSNKVIKEYDKLKQSIVEVSSNITSIQNKIKSYQDDISHIKLKNNKLQTNVDLLITELDNIQKLFNN